MNPTSNITPAAQQAKANATELVVGADKSEAAGSKSQVQSGPKEPSSLAHIDKKVSVPPDERRVLEIINPLPLPPSASQPQLSEPATPPRISVLPEGGMVVVTLPQKGRGMKFTPDEAMHFGNQVCRTAENIKAGIVQE